MEPIYDPAHLSFRNKYSPPPHPHPGVSSRHRRYRPGARRHRCGTKTVIVVHPSLAITQKPPHPRCAGGFRRVFRPLLCSSWCATRHHGDLEFQERKEGACCVQVPVQERQTAWSGKAGKSQCRLDTAVGAVQCWSVGPHWRDAAIYLISDFLLLYVNVYAKSVNELHARTHTFYMHTVYVQCRLTQPTQGKCKWKLSTSLNQFASWLNMGWVMLSEAGEKCGHCCNKCLPTVQRW